MPDPPIIEPLSAAIWRWFAGQLTPYLATAARVESLETQVTVGFAYLTQQEKIDMSEFADHLDKLDKAVTDAEARVTGDVDALKAKIAELQAKVDAGTATPAEETRLDALTARVEALDAGTPAPAPTPPTDPTPAPPAPESA